MGSFTDYEKSSLDPNSNHSQGLRFYSLFTIHAVTTLYSLFLAYFGIYFFYFENPVSFLLY